MERILSKEEISELLNSIRDGQIPLEEDLEENGPQEKAVQFDLFQSKAKSFELGIFDLILDSFARNFSISLTNRLQRSVMVKRTSIETTLFRTVLDQISSTNAVGLISMTPLRWGGLITLDDKVAFPAVEILLGANDVHRILIPNRALTSIETNILTSIFNDACADLNKAFLPVEKLSGTLLKMENNPRLINFVAPDAQIVKAHFRIQLNNFTGRMNLMIPLLSLEPLKEKFRAKTPDESQAETWRNHMTTELMNAEVSMEAQLGKITFTLRDILNFQVGDIIEMRAFKNEQLRVLVEGKPKYLGVAGVRNGKKAIRLTGKYRKETDDGRR
ncbi:MAG: flagellar motor switch protein FliM [Deltaproteobacteria bacterium]|nr:flagellar motor switch protein FliM [Deltaproteobacteria bacterium]